MKVLFIILFSVGIAAFVAAWLMYPEENHFSFMTCTISFLGSPDTDKNPEGFRNYQVGMSLVVSALSILVWRRHLEFRATVGWGLWIPTTLLYLGLFLVLGAAWVPDEKGPAGILEGAGINHNRIAIAAIVLIMFAVLADGVCFLVARVKLSAYWPVVVYTLLWFTGIGSMIAWNYQCANDPSLKHWPGPGIHSIPMWEWILFCYFIFYLFWFSKQGACRQRQGFLLAKN